MIEVKFPIIPYLVQSPSQGQLLRGEQYDGNTYDSDSLSHIAVEPSDSEGNSTNSSDRTVGRSHEPNYPEPSTGSPLIHNDAAVNVNNSTSNKNPTWRCYHVGIHNPGD